jgi:hypothetical protein
MWLKVSEVLACGHLTEAHGEEDYRRQEHMVE